jgi:structural maintenance of chromosome 1
MTKIDNLFFFSHTISIYYSSGFNAILTALYFCYSKEDAGMKTAKLRDEKEVIEKKLNADAEAKKNLVENMQQLESRKDEISSQERELQTKLSKILHSIPKLENELTHLHEEHNKIAKERQSSGLAYQIL